MPDVPVVRSREVIAALRKFGFEVDHQTGSHCVLKKAGHLYLVTVPIHAGKDVKKGTLRNIIAAAGVSIEEFTAALR